MDWYFFNLKRSNIMIISARVPFGSALMFTKLARGKVWRSDSGGSKLDTNIPNDACPSKKFSVLEAQVSPESVPGEYILLVWQQIVVDVISDTWEWFCGCNGILESAKYRNRSLEMITDGDVIDIFIIWAYPSQLRVYVPPCLWRYWMKTCDIKRCKFISTRKYY